MYDYIVNDPNRCHDSRSVESRNPAMARIKGVGDNGKISHFSVMIYDTLSDCIYYCHIVVNSLKNYCVVVVVVDRFLKSTCLRLSQGYRS